MSGQVQSLGPQLREVETACVAAKVVWAAAGSNLQSPTASELALHGKDVQLAWYVAELGDEVVRMRQEATITWQRFFRARRPASSFPFDGFTTLGGLQLIDDGAGAT